MNWFKENPFLAGLSAFTLIGAGILGFFLSQAASQYQGTQDGYAQAVAKLHALQERSPFPDQDNLNKSRAVFEGYKTALDGLRQQLSTIEAPLDSSVMPQQFQDSLRAAVNEVTKKATQAGVLLPKEFYLGFDIYSNSLPSEAAAPALARQLGVIKQIVERLIDLKVHAIDDLNRLPLPQETETAASTAAAPSDSSSRRNGSGRRRNEVKNLERLPFSLTFTSEQSKLRVAFNSFIGSDQFFIIRSINIDNTVQTGPSVARPPTSPSEHGMVPDPNALTVLLGREMVRATLQLEMIDFPKLASDSK